MSSILQTKEWAQFKQDQGFEILNLENIFIHKRKLPMGHNFLYIPEASADDLSSDTISKLKDICISEKSLFLRLELINKFSANADQMLGGFGFKKSFEEVQPKWRQIINLEGSEEDILSQMTQKGRYNVRLARRKNVKIKKIDLRGKVDFNLLKIFFDLYNQTVEREKIGGRSFQYFSNLVDNFSQTDYLNLYIAYYENEPIASSLVSYYDGVASYLYGGSSRRHKEVMAPYLMHFETMVEAKHRDCHSYDMIGRSAPNDHKSSWAGLSKFKESFGGNAVEILGSYDYIRNDFLYKIFKFIEKIRRH